MTKQDYESMTLNKLKEIAKELGIKNISKYKKNELITKIMKKKLTPFAKSLELLPFMCKSSCDYTVSLICFL